MPAYVRIKILLLLLLTSYQVAVPQSANYNFYNISTDNGLPTNDYQKIYYDSRGFLWLASFDGLFRWDGYTITKYLHNEQDSLTLNNNIVHSIYEDSQHHLWVGTIDGLHVYDPALDVFRRIPLNKSNDKIPVNAILEDDMQQLWLGTSNGLCHFNTATMQADWLPGQGPENIIFCLTKGQEHTIWAGTFNKGVIRFNTRNRDFQYFRNTAQQPHLLASNKIQCILSDRQQRIWVGTEDRGITVLDGAGKQLASFDNIPGGQDAGHSNIRCLYEDKAGTIWIGIGRKQIATVAAGTLQPRTFNGKSQNNGQPELNTITAVTEDNFGNTWFASAGNGIFSTNNNKNIFTNALGHTAALPGLNTTVVTALHEDRRHKIWIGTAGNGLLSYDPDKAGAIAPSPLYGNLAVNDIQEDASGNLWVATWADGLIQYDPATGKKTKYLHDPANNQSLINNDVKTILADDSLLWIGTHGEGICVLNLQNKIFTHYKNNNRYPFNMQLPAWVNHLYKDARQRIWISTYSGIFCYDRKTFHQFQHNNDSNSINSNSVNMVTSDQQGNIWIVTEQGLDRYEETTGHFVHYNARYPLPVSMKSIACDDQQNLWMGTNEGLICLQPATGKIIRYDKNDGLPQQTFFQKAALKASNGQLYFGGPKGFSTFRPGSIAATPAPAYFYFKDLSIFGEQQRPGRTNSALSRSLFLTDTITLTQKQSFFTIAFAAINLYAPEKIKYSYKLEGYFNDWIDVVDERKISFAHLPPGHYHLQVRYTDIYGNWLPPAKPLVIHILPYWWQTWWFYVLSFLLVVIAIISIFYWRVANVKKRNRLLKEEVKRQTQKLLESHTSLLEQHDKISSQKEKLEISYEEIVRQTDKILEQQLQISDQNKDLEIAVSQLEKLNKSKDYFFSILAHDLKNPVAALKELSGYLYNHMPSIEGPDLRQYLKNMHASSAHVFELLVNLLSWSMSQSKQRQLHPEACNLATIIHNNAALLENHSTNKHIHLVDQTQDHWIFADRQMMDVIIRNLLSNSIKFTDYGGSVTVKSRQEADYIYLDIIDTGIGMNEHMLAHLFDVDKNMVSRGTAGEKGTGLGLVIVKDFLEANHGTIQVSSAPGKGTAFSLCIPTAAAPATADISIAQATATPADTWQQLNTDRFIQFRGRKILVVEDNKDMRDYLRLLLSEVFEIFEAADGSSGIALAQQVLPAAIITDLLMPGINGIQFCKEIKTTTATSHIPVIILTSQDTGEMQASGYEAGADAYLTKPLNAAVLAQVLMAQLQKQDSTYRRLREQIFSDMPLSPDMQQLSETDQDFLQQLILMIEDQLGNQELDAKTIAKGLFVSRSLLYNKVKNLTGQTVHEFIKAIRLRKGLQLLLEENMTINQIAFEVGFNSHSYFDKCFIRQYGVGPKEYLNRKKKVRT
ncbi:two-component regulator propeller domain-containing protein [Chitinophaga sp. Cy-1792]|uniref:hybrid sensor histidine kinase/response regulator transcription factor n=1 Tax=Chitinophaga sp. Cy-1792 TaxID=2608339 RepID=UPI001420378D|nr:two-component regulator propeller domain-containing protein [Chitinophaga sp. Cy-1792]NIG56710.1 response regulator [Chitinophaga sp. Cy-1792]